MLIEFVFERKYDNMLIHINEFELELSLLFNHNDNWKELTYDDEKGWYSKEVPMMKVDFDLVTGRETMDYCLTFLAPFETQMKIQLSLKGEEDLFHLIPCNIHGDNNLENGRPDEFPMLTTEHPESVSCSPYWEFRADRASHPVSILCCNEGVVGISIEPYYEVDNQELIRNGLFSALPDTFGVSLGYSNDPVTFINHVIIEEGNKLVNKMDCSPLSSHKAKAMSTSGTIYGYIGSGRQEAHRIVENIYNKTCIQSRPNKTYEDAVKGLLDAFLQVNYSKEFGNYTNMDCHVPDDIKLKPWRPLVEIGWTGGGVIAYPLMVSQYVLGLDDEIFDAYKSPKAIMEEIMNGYNDQSGMLFDVIKPWSEKWPESRVNGWWSGFHLAEDCHTAYANGSALYYLFKMLEFMKMYLGETKEDWLATGLKVLDTVMSLQREDGAYGYLFSEKEKKVVSWDGFAGCWFVSAFVYAYKATGNEAYLHSAKSALDYYAGFVKDLNCWGTPMDTWNSIDEEGNLAFIKGARMLHSLSGQQKYLELLDMGVRYEYLWRYGFKAKPEFAPLKDTNWNTCGGSITSVSNPHMHPMGLLVTDEIEYLAKVTGNSYHSNRAEDGLKWVMATMELYPDTMGYGRYGVMSERFCPSDGLTIERYSDGSPCSTWFSYNGWAAANTLEAIAEKILRNRLI